MNRVTRTLRMRERARKRGRRSVGLPVGLGCSLIASLFFITLGIGAAFLYADLTRELASIEAIPLAFQAPDGAFLNPTKIFDRSGTNLLLTLENPGAGERKVFGLENGLEDAFPEALIDATLATQEPGYRTSSPLTILFSPMQSSGLARQLVASRLLWDEPPGVRREVRERLLAAQLLSKYGHERVLLWYLNSANYGRLTFGAEAASRVYFGKSVQDLTDGEAALLAAVALAPALNPHAAPEAAEEGMLSVLDRMQAMGYLDPDQAQAIRSEQIAIRAPVPAPPNPAPAFLNYVLERVGEEIPLLLLEQGGFEITTSLDYDLQIQSNCARDALLIRMESKDATEVGGEDCQAARLLPTLSARRPPPGANVAANAIIYDPIQAQILAMVGETTAGANPAVGQEHTPGTLGTTFVYLSGFTRGLSPASLLWDIPGIQPELDELVENYQGPMRLRTAFANDYLIPAASVLSQVGAENVRRTADRLGVTYTQENLRDGTAILTDGGTNLLEMVRAFGVFANQGLLTGAPHETSENGEAPPLEPIAVLSVQDKYGNTWIGFEALDGGLELVSRPVITNQLAYLVTQILSDESARWQSLGHPNALEIGPPVAAKLGRTLDGSDAWTIGYTPKMVIGVWMGPERRGETNVQPQIAADLWHALAQYALRDMPFEDWQIPPGINRVDVCSTSGLLPTQECPTTVSEIFLAGTEPTQRDYLYQSVQVNRLSGRLATVFTSPENLEQRVFLTVPEDAQGWAKMIGLPSPPEEYDILDASTSTSEQARIDSPGMFAYVRGEVIIEGQASGEGFQFYRLQAGKGLNPREWLLVGTDGTNPVVNGTLGTWDTNGLNGLYALQLLVVGQNQRVESVVTQVTVDNNPPELLPLQPQPGQTLNEDDGPVEILVEASDDLALASVSFSIDGSRLESLTQAPYQIVWAPEPGEHTLHVESHDQAGNLSELEIEFTVK